MMNYVCLIALFVLAAVGCVLSALLLSDVFRLRHSSKLYCLIVADENTSDLAQQIEIFRAEKKSLFSQNEKTLLVLDNGLCDSQKQVANIAAKQGDVLVLGANELQNFLNYSKIN